MNTLMPFILHNWTLVLAFVLSFIWVVMLEARAKAHGVAQLTPQQVVGLMNQQDSIALDFRSKDLFNQGHITHAQHGDITKVDEIAQKISSYRNKPVILICERGRSVQQVARTLRKLGFKRADVLAGGMKAWRDAGYPLVK